jgi:hypothetical protein
LTIKRVLGLGTYPIAKPIHGGQRRVAALKAFYATIGIDYVHAAIYDTVNYAPPFVGPHDIPLKVSTLDFGPVALTGDLLSGHQAETDAVSLDHFLELVERIKPDALQLEQPFLWPLAKRLRRNFGERQLPIVYSSHNVEAPLKREILTSSKMDPEPCNRICDLIEQMEAELSREAALIVCVSTSDLEYYRRYQPSAVAVVPNGVDRPPRTISGDAGVRSIFGDRRFLFMVGSAYIPNIEGFCACVAKDGMFFCPPVATIAVCGGVSDGILAHSEFRRFFAANSSRVHFFPKIDDAELWAVKSACHAVMLPILTGGGSNLKAAEALTLGKWIVATPMALRGFEPFADAEGVIVANDGNAFRRALARTLRMPPLEISEASRQAREGLYWDAALSNSALAEQLARL